MATFRPGWHVVVMAMTPARVSGFICIVSQGLLLNTSITGFDASTGAWFKIIAEKDGIQNTLRKHLDGGLNGQTYDINIPKELSEGSYILRFELIAFGQSSGEEGGQGT